MFQINIKRFIFLSLPSINQKALLLINYSRKISWSFSNPYLLLIKIHQEIRTPFKVTFFPNER